MAGLWLRAATMHARERTRVGEVKGVRGSTRVRALFYRVGREAEALR
jgi:hypothetical protein